MVRSLDLVGDHIGAYRVTGGGPERGYTAVHRHHGQRVQLFVAEPGAARALFERAQLFESLAHPGVARVIDRGALGDNRPWIAIDVPKGMPLFELVARRSLPSSEVATLVHDVADILAFAHERGIQHRNLTLRSIIITTGTRAYPVAVVDFGMPGDTDDVHALGEIAHQSVGAGALPELASLIAHMLSDHPPTMAEVRDANDDRVHATPRFGKPKWTPAPLITSEATTFVSGEISDKTEKI